MKAIVWTKYGGPDGLELREVEKPVPKKNELLIKVHATTVTAGDCELRSLKLPFVFNVAFRVFMGIRKPKNKILGQELSGVVESVGAEVTRFKQGDKIFAATLMQMGAYAQYACLPEKYPIDLKPFNMSYEEAATIPTGGVNGFHFVNKANLQSGEKLLINGAGGSIGTYALQIAKYFGAHVTCVDSSPKLEMLTLLGADEVIDYQKQDFTQTGKTYDVIIDIVGKSSFSACIRCLNANGRLVLGNPSLRGIINGIRTSWTTNKKVIFELAGYKKEDLLFLRELIEAGKVRSVIDRSYPLEQTPEAHAYVEKGLKAGNVVITVAN